MKPEPKRGTFAKEKGEVILREHEFDGIQEYDQKLPNWWLFTFYAAIVWFVIYWLLYYQFPVLRTDHENLAAEMATIERQKAADLEKTLAALNDSALVHEWAADPSVVASGEAVYVQVCAACHGVDKSATLTVGAAKVPLPGIPLNDGQWKFGGKPMEIFQMVNQGSPATSEGNNGVKMQPKGGANLSSKQVAEVVAYLISELPDEFKDIPAP
jgi:cytochrome c oxidase cbb3-type subunit III